MKTNVRHLLGLVAMLVACKGGGAGQSATQGSSVKDLMQARQLTEADVEAALKTYTPGGKLDEYMIFASGGHAGQVLGIGVPSMRMLKVIAVFAPEPWQASV